MKTALVFGAGGLIGSHMVTRLKSDGYFVRGIDIKYPEFSKTDADEFIVGDLRSAATVYRVMEPIDNRPFDLLFQFAADMGGAAFVFSGDYDAEIMQNSALINLHTCKYAVDRKVKKILYSSSACMYPQEIQDSVDNLGLKETDGLPANPDSEYGWEKVFSERLYLAYNRNFRLDVRICRFHNVFGENGCYEGVRPKAPSALCRKVALANDGDEIEVWGDGQQTRSFLYIDEAIEGCIRLVESNYIYPVNIGSDQIISINDLAKMVIEISGKNISIKNVQSNSIGVRGRNSENTLIKEKLNWSPTQPLNIGIEKLYSWVNSKTKNK